MPPEGGCPICPVVIAAQRTGVQTDIWKFTHVSYRTPFFGAAAKKRKNEEKKYEIGRAEKEQKSEPKFQDMKENSYGCSDTVRDNRVRVCVLVGRIAEGSASASFP